MKKSLKKVKLKGKPGKKNDRNGAHQVNIEETKDVSGGTGSPRDDSNAPK